MVWIGGNSPAHLWLGAKNGGVHKARHIGLYWLAAGAVHRPADHHRGSVGCMSRSKRKNLPLLSIHNLTTVLTVYNAQHKYLHHPHGVKCASTWYFSLSACKQAASCNKVESNTGKHVGRSQQVRAYLHRIYHHSQNHAWHSKLIKTEDTWLNAIQLLAFGLIMTMTGEGKPT